MSNATNSSAPVPLDPLVVDVYDSEYVDLPTVTCPDLTCLGYQADLDTMRYGHVLAGYEYFITFEHEYYFVWQSKRTSATWLLLANRYSMLVAAILPAMPSSPGFSNVITGAPALHLQWSTAVLGLLPTMVAAVFSALRVYALLRRSAARYVLGVFVLLLSLVPVITNIYAPSKATFFYVNDPVLGSTCYGNTTISNSANFSLCTRLAVILADLIVVVVTWVKTFSHVRQAASVNMQGLSATLLRDGSIYFFALLALNVAQLLVETIPAWQNGNPIAYISPIVQPVLISRFLINLRRPDSIESIESMMSTDPSKSTTIHFKAPNRLDSVIGPMDQPVDRDEDMWDEPFLNGDDGSDEPDDKERSSGERASDIEETITRESLSKSYVRAVRHYKELSWSRGRGSCVPVNDSVPGTPTYQHLAFLGTLTASRIRTRLKRDINQFCDWPLADISTMIVFRYALAAALTSALFTAVLAAPPCTSTRPVAICLEYLNPFSANAYEWTEVIGTPPSDPSVLCGEDGEFWDAIDGW
ncbi:hypothetical protein NM688_g8122 [Phlebia brevispora]|uniref:Uncharacterized protein n=1 Tax=Phlebia brevispora TaxID=194682 RepID=A0ACC1RX08_9APHY|nr:hypothetical protein NM688_g8122 [Phlebia brevispora]